MKRNRGEQSHDTVRLISWNRKTLVWPGSVFFRVKLNGRMFQNTYSCNLQYVAFPSAFLTNVRAYNNECAKINAWNSIFVKSKM
jgi:hypothetical protein